MGLLEIICNNYIEFEFLSSAVQPFGGTLKITLQNGLLILLDNRVKPNQVLCFIDSNLIWLFLSNNIILGFFLYTIHNGISFAGFSLKNYSHFHTVTHHTLVKQFSQTLSYLDLYGFTLTALAVKSK